MTDLEIQVDLEIRKLIAVAAAAERTAVEAAQAAKQAQENAI